jgi:flagellin
MTVLGDTNVGIVGKLSRNAAQAESKLSKLTASLATGLRVSSAFDDAAALSLATRVKGESRLYSQATRNVNDGVSQLNITQSALDAQSSILIRMEELATQGATATVTASDREVLDAEYQGLAAELERISNTTTFNGMNLLDPGSGNFAGATVVQAGTDGSRDAQIALGDIAVNVAGTGLGGYTYDLSEVMSPAEAANKILFLVNQMGGGHTRTWTEEEFAAFTGNNQARIVAGTSGGSPQNVLMAPLSTLNGYVSFIGLVPSGSQPGKWDLFLNAIDVLVQANFDDDGVTYTRSLQFDGSGRVIGDYLSNDQVQNSSTTTFNPIDASLFGASTVGSTNVLTQSSAATALTILDQKQAALTLAQSTVNAGLSRLSFALDQVQLMKEQNDLASNKIVEIDAAEAIAELTKQTIIKNVSTALLASANQSALSVVSLLNGSEA